MEGRDGGNPERVSRILVAVDGSEPSRRALNLAADVAKALGAEITILHVIEVEELPSLIGEAEDARADEDAQIILGTAAKLVMAKGVTPKIVVRKGHPTRQILRYSEAYSPQLIVLGSRGVTGARGVLLGSVSSAISKKARASVVLVR